jgi:DNA-binding LacI/PurR family transcriptional regulator
MRKVTIKDIAKAAGVSPTTVSFAFNSPERLPEATVNRVLELANELNYSPDPIARIMTSGRTGTLGILLANPFNEILNNPFFCEFLEGFGERCATSDLSIKIIPPREDGLRDAIINAAVDGIVTLGVDPSFSVMVALRQRGVPFMMVDTDPIDSVPTLNIDDQKGAFNQMEFVLSQGHEIITILGIRSGFRGNFRRYIGTLRRRITGYTTALSHYGLDLDGQHVRLVESACTLDGGRQAFEGIWKVAPRATAIVAMCDIIAFGAMDAARSNNVQIPRELSIIGFDDLSFSKLINPPLSTIHQPIRRKGILAADMLIRHIDGELEVSHKVLRTQLVIRDSVDKPLDFNNTK